MFYDFAALAALSTQISYRSSHLIADQSELACSYQSKKFVHEHQPRPVITDEVMLFMALTFGTLLSSQGADAHLREPFGSVRGNLCNVRRSVSQCQTDLLVPRPTSLAFDPRICYLAACPAGPLLSGSVRRAEGTLAHWQTLVKSRVSGAYSPYVFGAPGSSPTLDSVHLRSDPDHFSLADGK